MGTEIYDDASYFLNRPSSIEQLPYESGQLRYGDMCCAVGYALGLQSFEEVRNIFGFRDEGKENYPLLGAKMQMDMLWMARKRTPRCVLDIGGGRGEIALVFQYKDVNSVILEPSKSLKELVELTCDIFSISRSKIPTTWNNQLGHMKWVIPTISFDTIIFCESIEHIPQDEFDYAFIETIKPTLQRNNGMLIITNWLTPWPIEIEEPWHIRRCDDELYNWIAKDGETVYRNKNHLVVQF
jgi:hypothetical protein